MFTCNVEKLSELAQTAKQMQVNDYVAKQIEFIFDCIQKKKQKYAEILKEYTSLINEEFMKFEIGLAKKIERKCREIDLLFGECNISLSDAIDSCSIKISFDFDEIR